jgi:chromosome segregation ATPase
MKKLVLVTATLLTILGLAAVVAEKKAGAVSRAVAGVRAWFTEAVTPESQLETGRRQVEELARAVAAAKDQLAPVMQARDKERRQVGELTARHATREAEIRRMREALGQTSSDGRAEANRQLATEWEQFKAEGRELEARRAALESRSEAIETALAAIREMDQTRELLRAEVERLAAELRTARLQETNSHFSVDGKGLKNIQRTLDEVRDHLDAMKIRRELDTPTPTISNPTRVAPEDVLKQIDEELGRKG